MKKWVDPNKLLGEYEELDEQLKQFQSLMEEKPNWDKSPGARKVFTRKEFSIYRVRDGYIVHNTNKPFEKGHTHIHSFNKAKSLVDLCIRKKTPNTLRRWEIESLIRISNNQTYKNKLLMLLQEIDQ